MTKITKSTVINNKRVIAISFFTSLATTAVLAAITLALVATGMLTIGTNIGRLNNYQSGKPIPTGTAAEESQVINVVAKVNPAVVSIIVSKDMPVVEQYNPFDYYFGGDNSTQPNQNSTKKQEIGGGSGFFVSADGYIVTNNHVVEDSTAEYTVLTNSSKRYTAKILAKDSTLDVAVLKIDGNNFSYLSFADSGTIKLGQTVIAIGNALAEYQNSISMGVVSGLSRSITASDGAGSSEQLDGVIQTDAAINPGNSGGPLLDIKGNVIGVNVAIQNGAENIGFALPSNLVKSVAESVIKTGEIIRPYIGIRFTPVTETLKENNNLSVDYGVLVSKGSTANDLAVIPGSPADKAGIVENDIILEIDGVKLDSTKSFSSIIRQKQVGRTVTLKILHKNDTKEVKVKLEKAPNNL